MGSCTARIRAASCASASSRCWRAGPAFCQSRPNALAESTIGLFKAELIRPEGPWRNVEHVELETLRWVDFYNTIRPHEALDDLTPIQAEHLHYHRPRLTA